MPVKADITTDTGTVLVANPPRDEVAQSHGDAALITAEASPGVVQVGQSYGRL